jgi:hypothetical protein
MHELILWCAFAGAWLLFAGPVYQAVLELQAEGLELERIRTLSTTIAAPPPVSAWWWLLPPVRYLLEARRRQRYQRLLADALTDDDFEALTRFLHKATGWIYVGTGGLLIAVKETFELVDGLEWPVAVFWVLIALMAAISIGNTSARVMRAAQARQRRLARSAP